ncbi:MAG: hypothetical protein OHK0046_23390 [Anaerolineae bacterium]
MTTTLQQNTVLIIEDDIKINRMFAKQLEAAGLICSGVTSIREAVAYLTEVNLPNLIILDLELEDGIGTAVLDELQKRQMHETKVIIVSANAYSQMYDLSHYQVDHILVKPVSPRGLSVLVNELLS